MAFGRPKQKLGKAGDNGGEKVLVLLMRAIQSQDHVKHSLQTSARGQAEKVEYHLQVITNEKFKFLL
jgi:hypothetical protein